MFINTITGDSKGMTLTHYCNVLAPKSIELRKEGLDYSHKTQTFSHVYSHAIHSPPVPEKCPYSLEHVMFQDMPENNGETKDAYFLANDKPLSISRFILKNNKR